MKQRLAIVLMVCAAIAAASPCARAQVAISASIQINSPTDFYQPLSPYGSWVSVGSYGRCWHPSELGTDWQPYTVGSWEWTDAGWYWESDEPWAWACYHYGSWYDDPSVGWVWIPGTDWAPAWVTWRDSDDYIGWAPCGPGLSVLAPSFFVFCDLHHFHDHFSNRHDFIVNNTQIISRTRVIKDFSRQSIDFNGHQRTIFANRGPGVNPIERATGQKFTPRPVRDVIQQTRSPENMRGGEGQRSEQPGRQQTPAPTGREQQRNYQQPQQTAPRQRDIQQPQPRTPEQRPQAPAPTGREQQRNYQQPDQTTPRQRNLQQPEQRAPEAPRQPEERAPQVPQQRPEVNPPTGREQPRVYPEAPKPNPAPEQRKEVPTPAPRSVNPPERPLPPTGRQEVPHTAPPERQAPVAPQAPADGRGRDGRDRNQGQ
jgi:hypothetical protein